MMVAWGPWNQLTLSCTNGFRVVFEAEYGAGGWPTRRRCRRSLG